MSDSDGHADSGELTALQGQLSPEPCAERARQRSGLGFDLLEGRAKALA